MSTCLFIAAVLTHNAILQRDYITKSPDLTPLVSCLQILGWKTAGGTGRPEFFVGFLSYSQTCPCILVYLEVGDDRCLLVLPILFAMILSLAFLDIRLLSFISSGYVLRTQSFTTEN